MEKVGQGTPSAVNSITRVTVKFWTCSAFPVFSKRQDRVQWICNVTFETESKATLDGRGRLTSSDLPKRAAGSAEASPANGKKTKQPSGSGSCGSHSSTPQTSFHQREAAFPAGGTIRLWAAQGSAVPSELTDWARHRGMPAVQLINY